MTDNPPPGEMTREKALMMIRMVWAALLAGQITFLCVILVIWSSQSGFKTQPQTAQMLLYVSLGMLLTMVPVGYLLRSQIYKAHWREQAVAPMGYFMGNLLLLALCEGVALAGLVATLLDGQLLPAVLPSVAAMAIQVINWPHGLPMQPAFPNLPQQNPS